MNNRFIRNGRALVREFRREFMAMVFPDKCLTCGCYIRRDAGRPLSACFCGECMARLPEFDAPFCLSCGRLFTAGENHLCDACLDAAPAVEKVRAAFEYQGMVRDAVALLKYQGRLSLSRPLESYLFQAFCRWFDPEHPDLIIPIPLHKKKAAARGFNQSYLLIRGFSDRYRERFGVLPPWAIDIHSFARIRHTPSQTGLDEKQREENLDQAFAWMPRQGPEGKHILLVDDVYTTGSTCRAAAAALKAAGAASVSALVLARA